MKGNSKKGNKPGTSNEFSASLFPINKIIILNVSETDYPYFIESFTFSFLSCPICGSEVKYHATYEKSFYKERIDIYRVRCQNKECRKTHAIIPSFSVPCCSIGTKELNYFIKAREEGKTVEEAGQNFIDAGMSPDYPESIQRRLKRYQWRIEAIFSSLPLMNEDYASLILHLTDNSESPGYRTQPSLLCKGM